MSFARYHSTSRWSGSVSSFQAPTAPRSESFPAVLSKMSQTLRNEAEIIIPEPEIPNYFGKIAPTNATCQKNISPMATGSSHHWVICKVTSALHNLHTQFRVTFCPGTCPGFLFNKTELLQGCPKPQGLNSLMLQSLLQVVLDWILGG